MSVYVAEALQQQFPSIYSRFKSILGDDLKVIQGAKNLWCRDYMPVSVGENYVKFHYKTDEYDRWPHLKVSGEYWNDFAEGLIWKFGEKEYPATNIVLDGGNVIFSPDMTTVLMTEIVFLHNPGIDNKALTQQLRELLCVERIVFLPIEPGDDLGHADGIARFIDDKFVFVNDYSATFWDYEEILHKRLDAAGLTPVPFPNAFEQCPELDEAAFRAKYPNADDFNPGFGYYVNFLQHQNDIFVPSFGIAKDDSAACMLNGAFPRARVHRVDCSDLSMLGGLCNCVTWQD